MKKGIIFAAIISSLALAAGCGTQPSAQSSSSAKETTAAQTAGTAAPSSEEASSDNKNSESDTETSELTGTLETIKDFMITITDSQGTSYAMSFDATPEGLEDVTEGDTVTVTYTGELSQVDAFTGTVISVKKTEK